MVINRHALICGDCHKLMKEIKSGIKIKVESMAGVQACDRISCKHCGNSVYTMFGDEYGFNEVEEDIYIEKTY